MALNVTTLTKITYEKVITVAYQGMTIDPRFIKLLNFHDLDATSSDWPSAVDYELLDMANMIWKSSIRSCAPDPTDWTERDLNKFTNKHGDTILLEEVASAGSLSHLADN